MSNVLDLFDQTFASLERAAGILGLLQCVWVYDHEIDIDGVRQFDHHLRRGRLSRRIERSPLPFGRQRWVAASGRSVLEIVETPRPRGEFEDWLHEQAALPLDFEQGPEWRLAVLPFTDGGAGVSLVIPHCLTDGIGLCEALADAAAGRHDPISWPAAASRPRWQALREDARQAVRDIPAIGRALVSAAASATRAVPAPPAPPAHPTGPDQPVVLPTATIFINAAEWDARAHSLGGTSNTLLAGLAARLAHRMGRVTADGSVTLAIPVNKRTADDTRANAVTNVDIMVDPALAATNLRPTRATTKEALIRRNDVPDDRRALLPLSLVSPQWLVRRMVGMAVGSPTTVVSSNLGVVDAAAYRPDGTAADRFAVQTFHARATASVMGRSGGLVSLLSGRANGQVFVSVVAYQPSQINTKTLLQQHLSSTLNDFSLSATGTMSSLPSARCA